MDTRIAADLGQSKVNPVAPRPLKGGLCFFHANPNKASELGRIGGRSKRHAAPEDCDPLPTLDTAIAVSDMVARSFADAYSGKLRPSVAREIRQPF